MSWCEGVTKLSDHFLKRNLHGFDKIPWMLLLWCICCASFSVMYCVASLWKVIAVPRTLSELLLVAKRKLGLPVANKVYTAKGGLIDDVNLIRWEKQIGLFYVFLKMVIFNMIWDDADYSNLSPWLMTSCSFLTSLLLGCLSLTFWQFHFFITQTDIGQTYHFNGVILMWYLWQ